MPARQSRAEGVEDRTHHPPISDRLIAEAQQLHAEAEMLSREAKVWNGPAARRRLRDARCAETDLLRVLGFETYGDLMAAVVRSVEPSEAESEKSAPAAVPLPTAAPAAASDRDQARTRELERALGLAMAEIEELRTKLGHRLPAVEGARARPMAIADDEEALVRSFAADLERAAADVQALRVTIREVHDMAVEAAAELIVAKLEVLVAARRESDRR